VSLLGLAAPVPPVAAARLPVPAAPPGLTWQPGELLVRLCASNVLTLRAGDGDVITDADPAVAPLLRAWGLSRADEVLPGSGLYRMRGAQDLDVARAAADLAGSGMVLYAEPNYRLQGDLLPNDPQYTANQWALPQIHAPAAWDITTGKSSIILADVDTGIATDHPDLTGKLVAGYDFVNNDSNPYDDNGHGTYTAGIMAAQSNNGVGVTGVCWGCRLMPVKILDKDGGGAISDFARGIRWAVDHGARVLNISAGIEYPPKAMSDAVRYANQHGVVVVASAGNTPDGAERWPAAYNEVIAVTANDQNGVAADFASYGSFIDLIAPGVNILSTVWHEGRLTYAWGDGTSAAAPFVSGAAGLLLSFNPSLTPAQVKSALQDSADDLGPPGWDPHYGWGRLNIARALVRAGAVLPSPTASATRPPTAPATPSAPVPSPTVTPPQAVGGASLTVDPAQAAPGTTLTFAGSGFAPNELVGLRLIGSDSNNRYLTALLADGSGAFRTTFVLPPETAPGPATALAQGTVSGRQATATVAVGAGGTPPTAPPATTVPTQPIMLPPATLVPVAPVPVPGSAAFTPIAAPDLPDGRYFPEVGHTLRQPFLGYWEAHGGLPIFGYPISEPFAEVNAADGKTYIVQYFERNRFEYHPEFAGTPDAVLLGLLGREVTAGRTFDPVAPFTSDATRRYFPATGHSLQGAFLRYWQTRGGLALFGYPISEEFLEANPADGKVYTVQYFERNRFEYHPEFAGTPYEVLLGLLGTTVAQARGLLP
jgi:subtilisin family serine protease